MALANFFDRALLSAAQALGSGDLPALRSRLETQVVELAFDNRAANRAEGRAILDLSVRLLARLYPAVRLTALGESGAGIAPSLKALARAINPGIDVTPRRRPTVRLVAGARAVGVGPPTVYIGSDGWLAKVDTQRPQGCGASKLPFGAGGAACLGAANVFRLVFADLLGRSAALDEEGLLSLFDFRTGARAQQGPLNPVIDLGQVPLVGLGAIGNGLLWTLQRTPGLSGAPHLIDPEKVELSNLQRYVLATQADVGRHKVDLAREALAGAPGLRPQPFITPWSDYVEGRGHPAMRLVVAALDTAADRIAVQATLPQRALNAWTQAGDLGVSRHGFPGAGACLACLYMPREALPSDDVVIARALRLPTEPQEALHPLRELLINGQPVGSEFVQEAAARMGLVAGALDSFAAEPLRQFYAKAACGGAIVPQQRGAPPVEAPLAFQSAMAGVMLAAELLAEAGDLRATSLPTKSVLDLTRPVPSRLNFAVAKPDPAHARCLCQDADFVAAYSDIHGV